MPRLLRIAFWSAATFAFVMAVLPHPPQLPVSDKIQHMAAFFVLAVLGCLAYPGVPRRKLLVALIVYGGLIELVQMDPVLHRDSDWHDWAADAIAAVVALTVMKFAFGKRASDKAD